MQLAVQNSTTAAGARVRLPRTDILEDRDGIRLVADVPGVEENTIDVSVERGVLTLRAGKDEANATRYERRFTLPPHGYDLERIGASYRHGVLTVALPRAENLRARRIEVKS